MNIDPEQIMMDVELMSSSRRGESSNKGKPIKVPKVQNNDTLGDSDGDDTGSDNTKKAESTVFQKEAKVKTRMTQTERNKKYYAENREAILRKHRERHQREYVHKNGWVKPDNDEEKKQRIREAKRRYRAKQAEREKAIRAKPESEWTEEERKCIESIREACRRNYRKRKN